MNAHNEIRLGALIESMHLIFAMCWVPEKQKKKNERVTISKVALKRKHPQATGIMNRPSEGLLSQRKSGKYRGLCPAESQAVQAEDRMQSAGEAGVSRGRSLMRQRQ